MVARIVRAIPQDQQDIIIQIHRYVTKVGRISRSGRSEAAALLSVPAALTDGQISLCKLYDILRVQSVNGCRRNSIKSTRLASGPPDTCTCNGLFTIAHTHELSLVSTTISSCDQRKHNHPWHTAARRPTSSLLTFQPQPQLHPCKDRDKHRDCRAHTRRRWHNIGSWYRGSH